jgi:hypothetical protein
MKNPAIQGLTPLVLESHPMSGRFRVSATALAALLLAAGIHAARAQNDLDDFFDAVDHPAIGYRTVSPSDPVALLARRLADGSETLTYDDETGYLPALLRALDIPITSQLALFSKTSLQRPIISPQNPRALYFNESVIVAWPRGGFIEIASHDPRQGVMFYMLAQQRAAQPFLTRRNECLACHHSYDTGGVPGLLVRSVVTGPGGESMPFLGNYLVDDRSPLEERWAGWFVTGSSGAGRHLGNQMPPVTRDIDTQVTAQPTSVGAFSDALRGYLSQQSDIVAHLVFDHQVRMVNLLTRAAWQFRLADAEQRNPQGAAERGARELVDALLFVDEARLPDGLSGTSDFTAAFTSRGPRDTSGRSLRAFDLRSRLMRYPCSYMIYSEAFDALPPPVREAVYRRLWEVLSGKDKTARYARLSAADRAAVVAILRDTKKGLPDYFEQPSI